MSTVVLPQPRNPWDQFPDAVSKLMAPLVQVAEQKSEQQDAVLLASTPPEEIAKIMPQLKSPRMQLAALDVILKNQPRDVYQQQGGRLVKAGDKLPANAEIMKPDPVELELLRQRGRENLEDARTDRQFTIQGMRDDAADKRQAAQTERMMSIMGLRADQKTPNEIELAQRASRGDKDAQATLEMLEGHRQKIKSGPMNAGLVENPDLNLTGMDSLKNYTPEVQTRARALLEARMPFPTGYVMARDPITKAALQAAQEADPAFNAQTYKVRADTQKSFTSGKDAQNITSINTLVGHLNSLNDAAGKLGNRWSPTWNTVANMVTTGTGNPRVRDFNMALGAVESELAAVFKGTGASDEEIKAWRSRISSSDSPEQLQAEIHRGVDLMASRLEALRSKYEAGMGPYGQRPILSSKSRRTLEKLVGKEAADALEPAAIAKSPGAVQPHEMQSGATMETPQGAYVKGADGKWHLQE